ncbi:MAG: MBL fold metallo-hydrolase [Acidobacteriia bacterium]|nr:MBL fold metallo-hydrolase [Terriglobia bacterium]
MKRIGLLLGALAAMAVLPAIAWAQAPSPRSPAPGRSFAQWDKIQISVTAKLAPNLYILQGSPDFDTNHPDAAGGRVAVLFGPDGILLVDSEDEELHEKVLAAIRTFSSAPIRILVNSHIHSDHTGGDLFFAQQGALIFSREELRDEMLHPPRRADGTPAPAPDPAGVPVVTYPLGVPGTPAVTIHMDGEEVDFIPVPASHTGGDTVIRFQHANALYIGDFYRNFGYPFADQANGGSIRGMITAIDMIGNITGSDTTLITGHGTLVKKADLLPYRAMLVDILARTKKLVDQGKSLGEVLAANLTAPYDATTKGDTPQSKTRFITEVYDEVRGK